ncbi:hypothetical protein CYMTET_36392, partial [Cymbomonas tetramitiformis]
LDPPLHSTECGTGKSGFKPVYLRQTTSEITGEHSSILLRELQHVTPGAEAVGPQQGWLDSFVSDFRVRLMAMLGAAFRNMETATALSLLDPKIQFADEETAAAVAKGSAAADTACLRSDGVPLNPHDLRRLQSYANNLVDHHMVADLMPCVARAYFSRRIPVSLSYGQAAIMLAIGLQGRDISQVEETMNLPASQVLALFNKAMRKIHSHLRSRQESTVEQSLPRIQEVHMDAHDVGVEEDLQEGARESTALMQAKQQALMSALGDLSQYELTGTDEEWKGALDGKPGAPSVVTVKGDGSKKKSATKDEDEKSKGGKAGGTTPGKKKRSGEGGDASVKKQKRPKSSS